MPSNNQKIVRMEILTNAIISGTQKEITLMGTTFILPVIPVSITGEKRRLKYAEEKAKKLLDVLNS